MTDEKLAVEKAGGVEDDVSDATGADEATAVAEKETELTDEEKALAKLKEALEVEKEEVGPLHVKLTITIPRETIDEELGEQFQDLKREAQVPGFRKGHAPLKLIEKRFGADVGSDSLTRLVSRGYLAAVEKLDLKPLGDPLICAMVTEKRTDDKGVEKSVKTERLVPVDRALEEMKLPSEGPLTFVCDVELKPEFELPELTKIPVKRPKVRITKKDVDLELKRMRMSSGRFQPVEGGKVEADDLLYADMKMSVEGEVVVSEDNFDLAARDLRVKGVPLIEFADAVVGKKVGDEFAFEAMVPDDHDNIDIRSKTAKFDFVLHEIKRLHVPPIDAEFLEGIGFDTEEELRTQLKLQMESRLESTVKRGMHVQIGEYLVEKTDFEVPEGVSRRQTDRAIQRRMIDMYTENVPQAEIDKKVDEMRAKVHDQATHDLKLFFVLEKIAEEQDIEVREEEINSAIASIAAMQGQRFDRIRDQFSKGGGLNTLYLRIRDDKILDKLLADAEVSETKGPKTKDPNTKEPKTKEPKSKEPKAKSPQPKGGKSGTDS